jgi:hypothetical protein
MKLIPATGQQSMVHIRCRSRWIFLASEAASRRVRSVQFFLLGKAADFRQGLNSGSSIASEASGLLCHPSAKSEVLPYRPIESLTLMGKTLV